MPTLIAWGERDRTIPIEHGRAAHEAIAGSRFEILEGCAHFPHLEDPDAVARVLGDWMAATEPSRLSDAQWGELIRPRSPTVLRRRAA